VDSHDRRPSLPEGDLFAVQHQVAGVSPSFHRIHCGKNINLGRFPSRLFAVKAAWVTVVMLAINLIAWTQTLLLDGELTKAEPKPLRYRLLHVAARLTRSARRRRLRIPTSGPGPPNSPPLSPDLPPYHPASLTPLPDRPGAAGTTAGRPTTHAIATHH
jgi:DDE family transposase